MVHLQNETTIVKGNSLIKMQARLNVHVINRPNTNNDFVLFLSLGGRQQCFLPQQKQMEPLLIIVFLSYFIFG